MIRLRQNNRSLVSRYVLLAALCAAAGCVHERPADDEQAMALKAVWDPVVREALDASRDYDRKGELARAVEQLKVALTVDPANAVARQDLSRLEAECHREATRYYTAGLAERDSNPQQARKKFLAALRIRPDLIEAVNALKDQQLLAAETSIQRRLQREHQEEREAAPKAKPAEKAPAASFSLEKAMSAYQSGDYATAIVEFKKMKARLPNDPDIAKYLDSAYYQDGLAKYKRKEYRKALESFTKVHKGFENVDDYIARCKEELAKDHQ